MSNVRYRLRLGELDNLFTAAAVDLCLFLAH